MVILENLILALQSLKSNPLRSVLTLVGIAVGIAAVLYVVTLGEITQRRINEQLESMGSNVLMIRPGYSRMRGVRTGANVVNLTLADAREIEQASQVITSVTPTYSGQSAAEYKDQNWSTRITGTTPEYTRVNNEKIIEGRFFTAEEMERRARVCVLGATVHEKLFGTAAGGIDPDPLQAFYRDRAAGGQRGELVQSRRPGVRAADHCPGAAVRGRSPLQHPGANALGGRF